MVKNDGRKLRVRMATAHAAGPVAYAAAARPTISLTGIQHIETLDDIDMWSNGGYEARPVGFVTDRRTVRYMVMSLNRNAQLGCLKDHPKADCAAALAGHAAHQHDISLGVAAGNVVMEDSGGVAGTLGSVGGVIVCADALDAGALSAHAAGAADAAHAAAAAALKDTPAVEEVLDGTDISGVTFYIRANGHY